MSFQTSRKALLYTGFKNKTKKQTKQNSRKDHLPHFVKQHLDIYTKYTKQRPYIQNIKRTRSYQKEKDDPTGK